MDVASGGAIRNCGSIVSDLARLRQRWHASSYSNSESETGKEDGVLAMEMIYISTQSDRLHLYRTQLRDTSLDIAAQTLWLH